VIPSLWSKTLPWTDDYWYLLRIYLPFLMVLPNSMNYIVKKNSVAWVCELTILTKRPPLVSEVSANVVSVTDPYGRILGFLDRGHYFFFQVAPQLYSQGWVDPITDPFLLWKSGSTENWTRTSGSVARNSDH
jgi:hypothetical protein